MPDDTPEIRFWKDEALRVIKATLDDAPTAPCEECHIPLELDTTPKPNKPHLCGPCRRQLAREKWADRNRSDSDCAGEIRDESRPDEPTLNWKSHEALKSRGSRDW